MEVPERSYTLLQHVTGTDHQQFTGVDEIKIRVGSESDARQFLEAVRGFMLAIGYHPNSIDEYLSVEE